MSKSMTGVDPIKILVADDSATVRKFIEVSLDNSRREIEFTMVSDGQEAVRRLETEKFDIAFLDIQMPHLSGVEVMGVLHLQSSHTFAVSMSTGMSQESESLLKSFGAYDFLTKPFTRKQVCDIVDTFDKITTPFDILIVDDSATVRKVVLKVLDRTIFNLNVMEAGDGETALKLAKTKPFRIIFTDMNMPGMSGLEVAEELATLSKGSDVILMSGEYTEKLDHAAMRVGARAFLRKPFYPADIDSVLHHLFGLRHPHFSSKVRMLR